MRVEDDCKSLHALHARGKVIKDSETLSQRGDPEDGGAAKTGDQ